MLIEHQVQSQVAHLTVLLAVVRLKCWRDELRARGTRFPRPPRTRGRAITEAGSGVAMPERWTFGLQEAARATLTDELLAKVPLWWFHPAVRWRPGAEFTETGYAARGGERFGVPVVVRQYPAAVWPAGAGGNAQPVRMPPLMLLTARVDDAVLARERRRKRRARYRRGRADRRPRHRARAR